MTRAHVIGMGRLGAHLAHRLEELDIEVTRWNRTPLNGARALSEWTGEDQPDAVFLAVSDDAHVTVAPVIGWSSASSTVAASVAVSPTDANVTLSILSEADIAT